MSRAASVIDRRYPEMSCPLIERRSPMPVTSSSRQSPTYTDLSAQESIDCLRQIATDHHVVPAGYGTSFSATLNRLQELCDAKSVGSLTDLVMGSGDIIAEAAAIEASMLTRFQGAESADQIHIMRNTLAAVIAACAIGFEVDADHDIAAIARVCPRGSDNRTLTDDEIVVLRLITLRDASIGGRRSIAAARYVMADAGLYPSETTVMTAAMMDFDADRQPILLRAPGVNTRAIARTVPLDSFGRCALADIVATHLSCHAHARTSPIGYTGTHSVGGHSAGASASTGLKRLFKRAGLDTNLEPLGIIGWRITHAMDQAGIRAALTLSGKDSVTALSRHIKIPIDQPAQKARTKLTLRPEQLENAEAMIVTLTPKARTQEIDVPERVERRD